jgi:hypothetical protein
VAKGYRYAEVPISYRFRRHGRSFVRLGPYLRRIVPAIWRELRTTTEPAGVPAADPAMVPVPVLVSDAPRSAS